MAPLALDLLARVVAGRANRRPLFLARRPTHQAGVKLQNMIRRIRASLFVFVTNRDLPATNNGSERALRSCAVFRKITNGFRTDWGARLYADVRSTIETAGG